jgi:hypothetical protein
VGRQARSDRRCLSGLAFGRLGADRSLIFESGAEGLAIRYPLPVMASLLWLLLPLLLLVAVLDLLTMSPARRAQLLRRSGFSQLAISQRLGVSRYRVRQYLAA